MEDRIDIIRTISELKKKAERFKVCLGYLLEEEGDNNDENVIKAWRVILDNHVSNMYSKLICLREEIQWSLIDDQSNSISEIKSEYCNAIDTYKGYADEGIRKTINSINSILDEGVQGFRQSMITDDYYEELFNKHYLKYREENEERLELIYNQDFEDLMDEHHDETICKNKMVSKRRDELFKDKYGMMYHEQGRKIKLITFSIIENHEQNEIAILSFIDKLLAFNIAIEKRDQKEDNTENIYENIIFKENVNVNKVISKLKDFVKDGVITAKSHWYIVYRVFLKKEWLVKDNQVKFRKQIYLIFGEKFKCSKDNFGSVDILRG